MTDMTTTTKKKGTLIPLFADRFHIDPDLVLPILKATAFKVSGGEVSNEQMAALLSVANQYGLNPFTREIFAFEDKFKGIVPVVSVDGWSRITNDHPEFDGVEFVNSEKEITAPDGGKKAFEWIECVIHRKDRQHPIKVREYFDEVYQKPRGQNQTHGPWQTHPKRMHRHKVFIQCARLAFGFGGIYDEDEAMRVIEGQTIEGTTAAPERSSTARIAAALDLGGTAGKQAATAGEVGASAARPLEDIELDIAAAKSPDELKGILDLIGFHPDSERRREVVQKWNKKGQELAPKEQQQPPPASKEVGSVQRANNIIKQMKDAANLDALNEVLDYANGFSWEVTIWDRIKNAYEERKRQANPEK